MEYDPLDDVIDEPLTINEAHVAKLLEFRHREPKVPMLPGVDVVEERERLSRVLNDLVDRLIQGVGNHPSKLWVLKEFQHSLQMVEQEDTEAREHFGMELEQIMDILDIESSDGLLACYLGGI